MTWTPRTALLAALLLAASGSARAGVCEAHFALDRNFEDSSGNGYHGLHVNADNRPIGGGLYEPGRFGLAMRMYGTAAVAAPLDLHWDFCPKVTIALWVRLDAEPTSFNQLVSTGYGAGPKIGIDRGRIDIGGGAALGRALYTIEPGVWTPLVGTWDYETGGELTLHWPEGSLSEPLGTYTQPPEADFWIGADGYLSSLHYMAEESVLIDDVRVWGRILSPDEIAAVLAGNPPEVARCPCGTDTGAPSAPPAPSPGPPEEDTTPTPLLDPPPTLPEPGVVDADLTPLDDLPEPPPSEYDPDPAAPRPDPRPPLPGADLTPLDDLPEPPPSEYDPEPYMEKRREEYEQSFGPRDRAQVVIGTELRLGYAAVPGAFVSALGSNPDLNSDLQAWLTSGKKIRELLRIRGTTAMLAVADDGSVAMRGNDNGKATDVIVRIGTIRSTGRPIDLVADSGGSFVVISGTNVYSHQVPESVVNWAHQELAAGLQITALALIGADAWIGVSQRGVASDGLHAHYFGYEVVDDVQRFIDAGEVVQDISLDTGRQYWAIATDKRVFVRGFDCREYAAFGADVESELSRQWDCEVFQRNCLENRATWDENDMGSDADPDVWQVNLLVTIGIDKYEDEAKEDFDCWLEQQLRRAELLYIDKPSLKLRLRTQRLTRVDGVDLPQFVMDSQSKYASFMDRNFDIMAKSKTEGYYPVLVVNQICIGKNKGVPDCEIGGQATFPHVVNPMTRKHGIIMQYSGSSDLRDWVLAHELGHYLSLVHTFETQSSPGAMACNNVYYPDPLGAHECNSCQGTINSTQQSCSATYNVMDYCWGNNDDVRVNACQRERAARQRERYQTGDGQTNYIKMKGRLGEPYCSNDSDCLDDEYCDTGVATVGRNVCKSKLSDGSPCWSSGQCASGNCSVFKCK